VHVVFNVFANTANAVNMCYFAYQLSSVPFRHSQPLMLGAAACAYFLTNTVPVALVIALTEQKSFRNLWAECYFWSFPYYLAGAALAGFVAFLNRQVGWQTSVLILPVVFWIYRSYSLYLGRLEDEKQRVEIEKLQVEAEKRHVDEVSALQARTIEALALAIDAKDHTTHSHLHRVRTYALEIAKDLELCRLETDALRAAALLHDIGKLAVPDQIINKPGRLTPEEFEKMKIHPVVGAEILEKVEFPYPVAPIVRAHHEKWDGTGYPDGLKGEEIPIGARILSAVDCLDALATDRQYRKGVSLDAAMKIVAELAGTAYDPRVVEILQRRYLELEELALTGLKAAGQARTSANAKVERGEKPAAGFEKVTSGGPASQGTFLSSIASARYEAQTLFELSQELGNSLSLDETLSLVSVRLRKLIPYDSFVTFVLKGDVLIPEFISGDNYRAFSSLEIPLGEGLCGWVARNAKPIVNGNPLVESGYGRDLNHLTPLRSALVVPLEGVSGLVGVLALYQSDVDAFSSDNLRVLQVITSKTALSIENALRFRQVESTATTDYLTGLPNARALMVYLHHELARCTREKSTLAVLVCDLDGFKQINDRFGHLEGDNTLRIFAQLMRNAFREYDYIARMGGDEFVVVTPNLEGAAAEQKVAYMTYIARQAGRQVCGEEILSLSVGAAYYPHDGADTEKLLAIADKRMYAVKQRHHAHPQLDPVQIRMMT